MTDDNDETTLIQRAQSGDSRAFELLLERYYDTLFKFAFKWCGKREDAEDIAQQACIKLAKGLKQFRFESSFTSWLYRLVINCAKDWQKSQTRHQAPIELDANLIEITNEEQLDKKVLYQQLLKRLENLADGMKETILLVHAEGFTHNEAAIILGVKESTISWRIHEIRKQLQPFFGQEKQ